MHSDDPDRAAILARRQRLILLALTGVGVTPTTGCRHEPCLPDERYDVDSRSNPVTTVCPAELGPFVSLMDGTQIRLPEGMTPEAMVQPTPYFVRLSYEVESVSCIDAMPGGTINFFAMTVFLDDPSKSMPTLRDELLAAVGYTAPTVSAEVIDEVARSYEVVIDQLPQPNSETLPEPARAFLCLKANAGQIYAVIYEVHPHAWNALEASLRASAASLSFSSP